MATSIKYTELEALPVEVQNNLKPCAAKLAEFFKTGGYIYKSKKNKYFLGFCDRVYGNDLNSSNINLMKKRLSDGLKFVNKAMEKEKDKLRYKFNVLGAWPDKELNFVKNLVNENRFLSLEDFTPVEKTNIVENTSQLFIRFSDAEQYLFSSDSFSEEDKSRIESSSLVVSRRNELIFSCIEKQGWKQTLKKMAMKNVGQPCSYDKDNLGIPAFDYIEFLILNEDSKTNIYVKFNLKNICLQKNLLLSIDDDSLIEEEIEDAELSLEDGEQYYQQNSTYSVIQNSPLEKAIRKIANAPGIIQTLVECGTKKVFVGVARKYKDIYSDVNRPVEFAKTCTVKTIPSDGSAKIYMVRPKSSDSKAYFWSSKDGKLFRDFNYRNSIVESDYPAYPQDANEMIDFAESLAKSIKQLDFIKSFPISADITVSFFRKKLCILFKEFPVSKDSFTSEFVIECDDISLTRNVELMKREIVKELAEPLLLTIIKQYGNSCATGLFGFDITPVQAAILQETPATKLRNGKTRTEICKCAHAHLCENYPMSYIKSEFDKIDEKGVYSATEKKKVVPFEVMKLRGTYGQFFVYSRIKIFENIDFTPFIHGEVKIKDIPTMTSDSMVKEFEKRIKSVESTDDIFALLSIMDCLPKMKLSSILKSEDGIDFLRKIKEPNDRKFAAIIIESLPGCKKLIKTEFGEDL